ncbi:MAG: hypothetical protein MAG715_00535 [Methanonatronarchaeales archaeon]|nr:hypothetical protein [Methanonatronarchaeales archaeon]
MEEMRASRTSFEVLGVELEVEPMRFVDTLGELDGVAQAVDARFVAGREHLEVAAGLAFTAEERGRRVANDPAMEVLLYAAGTRQIDRAIERLGLRRSTRSAGVVLRDVPAQDIADSCCKINGEVLELSEDNLGFVVDAFEIGELELETVGLDRLPLLVRERVVLSDLER